MIQSEAANTLPEGRLTAEIDGYVGMRICEGRRQRGFSQRQLGDLIGVRAVQVYKYEKGLNRVSAGVLYEIASALDFQISYFYDGLCEAEATWTDQCPPLGRETTRHFSAIRNEKHRNALNQLVRVLAGH